MNDLRDREELARLLSNKLKELMERDKVSLHVLSTRLGINKSTLHNWLNGVVPQPLLALLRISDFFGVKVDELCSKSLLGKDIGQENAIEIKLLVSIESVATSLQAVEE